jgi:phage-related protein
MRRRRSPGEKPLHWIGSSKGDLMAFPEEVVDNIGYALSAVQHGGYPPSAKPWKGLGSGVHEIVEGDQSGTFRLVYAVRFRKAVYVLHAFQKKSPSGVRTARTDIDLIEKRLNAARRDYEERYGKKAD